MAVAVLGGQSEAVSAPAAVASPAAPRIAVASGPLTAAVASGPRTGAVPSGPLTAAVATDGALGPMLIPYEWRARLADRVDRFTIDDSVLLAIPDPVDRFTIDDSVFALATPPRRSDWPRAIASPYPR